MPLPVSYHASRSFSFRSLPATPTIYRDLSFSYSRLCSLSSPCSFTPHTQFVLFHRCLTFSHHIFVCSHISSPYSFDEYFLLALYSPHSFLFSLPLLRNLMPSPLLPLLLRRKRKCTRWKAYTQSLSFPRFPFLPISDIATSYVNCPPSLLCRFSPRYASLPILSSPDFSLCPPFVPPFPYLRSARSVLSASIQTNATHASLHSSCYERHLEVTHSSNSYIVVNLCYIASPLCYPHRLYAIFTYIQRHYTFSRTCLCPLMCACDRGSQFFRHFYFL